MKTILSLFLLSSLCASAQTVTFKSSATLSGLVTIGPVSTNAIGGGGGGSGPSNMVFTAQSLGTLRNDFTGDLGMTATFVAGGTMTHLGRWVVSGNSQTHTLKLWDAGQTLLQSVTVNCSGAAPGTYVWAALTTPVTITPGATYFITSSETSGGDQFYNNDTTFTQTMLSSFQSAYGTPPSAGGGISSACFVPVNVGYHN